MKKEIIIEQLKNIKKSIEQSAKEAEKGWSRASCYPEENAYCSGLDRGIEISLYAIDDLIDELNEDY